MKLCVTNVHLDLGASRRGTDMGPSAIHVAGLIPKLTRSGVVVKDVVSIEPGPYEIETVGDPHARFLVPITRACSTLADRVERIRREGDFALVLGGDHAQAIGTLSGMARALRGSGEELGVIWVDAHTDMNTPESSPSGNIHGMPLATLLGHGPPGLRALAGEFPALKPENVVVIGARDVDPTEAPLVRELGVRVYTMSELDARGTALCLKEAFDKLDQQCSQLHLSFDLDGVDPVAAPGVGTPVPGGLTLRESHLICEMAARTGKLVGMEMVELNPTLDIRNQTAEFAVWLIESALGRTIL